MPSDRADDADGLLGAACRHLGDGPNYLSGSDAALHPSCPGAYLHHAVFREGVADDDADRHAQQIGILELHPWALVTVVEQRLDARGPEAPVDRLRGGLLVGVTDADQHHVHVEGASAQGQMIPSASWDCSTAAAATRAGPIP